MGVGETRPRHPTVRVRARVRVRVRVRVRLGLVEPDGGGRVLPSRINTPRVLPSRINTPRVVPLLRRHDIGLPYGQGQG